MNNTKCNHGTSKLLILDKEKNIYRCPDCGKAFILVKDDKHNKTSVHPQTGIAHHLPRERHCLSIPKEVAGNYAHLVKFLDRTSMPKTSERNFFVSLLPTINNLLIGLYAGDTESQRVIDTDVDIEFKTINSCRMDKDTIVYSLERVTINSGLPTETRIALINITTRTGEEVIDIELTGIYIYPKISFGGIIQRDKPMHSIRSERYTFKSPKAVLVAGGSFNDVTDLAIKIINIINICAPMLTKYTEEK